LSTAASTPANLTIAALATQTTAQRSRPNAAALLYRELLILLQPNTHSLFRRFEARQRRKRMWLTRILKLDVFRTDF